MSARPLQRPRPLYITCDHAAEDLLALELKRLGASSIQVHHRGVHCTGHEEIIWRINLFSRLANRVLIPIAEFPAFDREELYTHLKKIRWDWWITPQHTIAVDASSVNSELEHTHFIAQVAKDAIVDAMRERVQDRPFVDVNDPDLPINIHLSEDYCTVSLDSSGDRLHRRGYRTQGGQAPIKETLASVLNHLAQWKPHEPLIDLSCGSGSIIIEAALRGGLKVPGKPRALKKGFAFQKWLSHAPGNFEEWIERLPQRAAYTLHLWGSDVDARQMTHAQNHARNAQVNDLCHWVHADFQTAAPQAVEWVQQRLATHPAPKEQKEARTGIVLMNPPYGVRLGQTEELITFYRDLGKTLKKYFKGYEAWILVAKEAPWKEISLKTSQKISIRNGGLDCWLLQYSLYT